MACVLHVCRRVSRADLSVRSILRGHLLAYRKMYGHLHDFTRGTALQLLQDACYEVLDFFFTYECDTPTRIHAHEMTPHPLLRFRKLLGTLRWRFPKQLEKLAFALHQDGAVRIVGSWRLLILAR